MRGWSAASRRRLLFGIGAIDFDGIRNQFGGTWASLTLTYRDDPGPAGFRRHRLKLLDQLRHRLGSRRLIWKVEFQRRGVVHLHLVTWVPFTDAESLGTFRLWLWDAWEGITGGRHRVDARFTTAYDMARYVSADWTMRAKGYQYRVPASWSHVGRWWAIVGLPAAWTTMSVDRPTFVRARRLLRRHRVANATYRVRGGRSRGLTRVWVLGTDVGSLERDVRRYLQSLTRAGP